MSRGTCPLMLIVALAPGLVAEGGQRLVGPGDEWSTVAADAAPGDEIVLMPGRHRAAELVDLRGEPGKPIVVRSLAADRPAVIEADREGLRLVAPRHVVVRDLIIEGAEINGITVTPPAHHEPGGEPWQCDLRLFDLTVARTGPSGKRHGIQLSRVSNVEIERCTIEGWGGAGIDVTACRSIKVAHTTFRGLEQFTQRSGLQVRGGSSDVRLFDCTLVDAGVFPITLGGEDDPLLTVTGEILDPPLRPVPRSTSHLVRDVQVARCVVRGGGCPLRFTSAADCRVRNLTIVGPSHGVVAIDLAPADTPFVPSTGLTLGQCLIAWAPSDPQRLFRVGPHPSTGALTLGSNLWWSGDPEGGQPVWLEPPAAPQVVDVDPQLDDELAPRADRALLYGTKAP